MHGHASSRAHLRKHQGQAKIHDFHHTLPRKKDVRRLDITVNDVVLMGLTESVCNLARDSDRVVHRERTRGNPLRQRHAFVKGHDDECLSVRRFFDRVNDTDIRMIEG